MRRIPTTSSQTDLRVRTIVWIMIVLAATVGASLALACATPFAALATIAGTRMRARGGAALLVAAWLANQLVGYGVLGYPHGWESVAWGGTIAVATLLAGLCAGATFRRVLVPVLAEALAFAAAFLAYEATLFAATAVLPSGVAAFSWPIIAGICAINAAAAVALLLIHRLAVSLGLQPYASSRSAALSLG